MAMSEDPGSAQLNTAMASFFNLDWANPTAECRICGQCGYVHWFRGQYTG